MAPVGSAWKSMPARRTSGLLAPADRAEPQALALDLVEHRQRRVDVAAGPAAASEAGGES
jgi:hypothetical protein